MDTLLEELLCAAEDKGLVPHTRERYTSNCYNKSNKAIIAGNFLSSSTVRLASAAGVGVGVGQRDASNNDNTTRIKRSPTVHVVAAAPNTTRGVSPSTRNGRNTSERSPCIVGSALVSCRGPKHGRIVVETLSDDDNDDAEEEGV